MAPVQSKLFPGKNLHQTSLVPVVATTPHCRANFMSLGRIVVENTTIMTILSILIYKVKNFSVNI